MLTSTKAQQLINIAAADAPLVLTEHLEVLEDVSASYSLEEVQQKTFTSAKNWIPPQHDVNAYWTRITLQNTLAENAMQTDWLLAFHPLIPDIKIYIQHPNTEQYQSYQLGHHIPYAKRSYHPISEMSRTMMRLHLPTNQPVHIYAQIIDTRAGRTPILDVELAPMEQYGNMISRTLTFNALMIGGLIMMILFVLSLGWYEWRAEYGYYILYLLIIILGELFTTGFESHYITHGFGLLSTWAESTIWSTHPAYITLVGLTVLASAIAYILFIDALLNLKKIIPLWHRIFRFFILFALATMGLFVYVAISSNFDLVATDKVIAIGVFTFIGLVLIFLFELRKQHTELGKFVILGYVILVSGSLAATFGSIYPSIISPFSDAILMVAIFTEKLVFTFALSSRRYNTERKLRMKEHEQRLLLQEQHQDLQVAHEKTLVAAKAKREFMAVVSHELRTPMNSIVGFTELLKEYEPTPDQQFCIENLDISNKNMLKMIDNLLYFMDLENEDIKLEKTPFKLHQLLQTTIKSFQATNDKPNLDIQLSLNKYNVAREVIGDVRCLKQVLHNLLDNAVKFTPEGKVSLQATVLEQDDTEVCINFQVRDTGIGIPLEKQLVIFEAFTQVSDSYNRSFDGLGLGLPLCKRLVKLHGGKIKLQSEVNKGTTISFDLRFPLVDVSMVV